MRRLFVVTLLVPFVAAAFGFRGGAAASKPLPGAPVAQAAAAAGPLVGTWKLVSVEQRGPKGELLAPKAPGAPVGLMMCDPDGFVGLAVMQSGRQKYGGSEPTPAEAKAAFESFTSIFGTYTADQRGGSMVIRVDGSLDPNLTSTEYRTDFTLSGNRLTMKARPSASGRQDTFVWERAADASGLTDTHRRLIGFWKLVPNEGDKVQPGQEQRRGYIIYTAAGLMAVHIMPGGRPKFAGAEPTPDEAKTAMRAYTSYFGPFRVNEQDRYVVHERIAHTIPASIGTNAQRFYEFSGKRLVLRLVSTTFTVPTTLQAAKSEGREPSMITWERISAPAGGGAGRP